eukprot:CAMPEP_0173066466 /NCGR_PEP_ID=MMETSP1102-20130122/6224_2 /TAXON_ID=49646 /ORGANISM="Geminigera sp., Strain Caron Lab Isolate" /LENGTH=119 /DNA_ID=CAMNT_0013933921 /DNA_START=527 /DNA_END=882 /DNA_ORIENTATION=-
MPKVYCKPTVQIMMKNMPSTGNQRCISHSPDLTPAPTPASPCSGEGAFGALLLSPMSAVIARTLGVRESGSGIACVSSALASGWSIGRWRCSYAVLKPSNKLLLAGRSNLAKKSWSAQT